MTRRDKKILWVGALLVLAYAAWWGTFKILSIDAPPPDDADLLPRREPVPPEQNAFDLFEKAGQRLEQDFTYEQRHAVSDMVDGHQYDAPQAENLLQAGEEALALWREGLERPGLQVPPIDSLDTEIGYCFSWMGVARLADLRALSLGRQGEHAKAFQQSTRIVRFGRRIMGSEGNLVVYLVGRTVEGTGLRRIRLMLSEARLSREQVAQVLKGVTPEEPVGGHFAEAMRVEYAVLVNRVEDMKAGRLGPPEEDRRDDPKRMPDFALQVNRTKRTFARYMRPFIEDAGKAYPAFSAPELPSNPMKGLSSMFWAYATGNGLGKWLTIMLSSVQGAFEIKCQRSVNVAATRLLLALKAYKMDKGRLPETLGNLVPAYLEAVPADGFDGEPFRYDRSKEIIWSVGKNLTDDSGEAVPYDEPGDGGEDDAAHERADLVFPIRF